jgi:hypothetical protein
LNARLAVGQSAGVTTQVEANERRAIHATAVYGALSIALVIVTWEADGNDWHLVEVIAGYAITLWLMHTYAALVSKGTFRGWRQAAREEFPVAAAALPALGVAFLGELLAWGQEETADVDLIVVALTLIVIQATVVRELGYSRRRLLMTIAVDMFLAAVIIILHVAI